MLKVILRLLFLALAIMLVCIVLTNIARAEPGVRFETQEEFEAAVYGMKFMIAPVLSPDQVAQIVIYDDLTTKKIIDYFAFKVRGSWLIMMAWRYEGGEFILVFFNEDFFPPKPKEKRI